MTCQPQDGCTQLGVWTDPGRAEPAAQSVPFSRTDALGCQFKPLLPQLLSPGVSAESDPE